MIDADQVEPVAVYGKAGAAKQLLEELAESHVWVSVLYDRGWGEPGTEAQISVITDGDGQQPHAYITDEVYRELLTAEVLRPNSLATTKDRQLHDFSDRHPFVDDGSARCRSCDRPRGAVDHREMGEAAWVEPDRDVADRAAPQILAEALAGVECDGVPVEYTLDGQRVAGSVQVSAWADGFQVNAYGAPTPIGCLTLPVGEHGLGVSVGYGDRPGAPGWQAQVLPRLQGALRDAVAVVRADRDGDLCGHQVVHQNGSSKVNRRCLRPAGHDSALAHSDTFVRWNSSGEVRV